MTKTLRLLVLEDEPNDAKLEIAALEEEGYDCQWERIDTREDYLARLESPDYDIILSDYSLPAFDGLTALNLVLERDLEIPFILVSGTLGEDAAIESLKAGATDYVLKNRLSRLGPVVERALKEFEDRRERRRAQEQVKARERYFRSLMYGLHEDIIVIDHNYIITDMNNSFLHTVGLPREEVIGKHCYEVAHCYAEPCANHDEECVLQEVFKTGESQNSQHAHIGKDGSTVHVDILLSPMKNEEGEVVSVVEAMRDVTDLVKARESAIASEERARLMSDLVMNSNQPVAIGFSDGCLGRFNPAFCELTGYSEEELQNINWATDLTPAEWKSRESKVLDELKRTGKPVRYEKEYIRKDGTRVPIELFAHMSCDSKGEFEYYYAFITDISERQKMEERVRQMDKMDAIGHLAGGIAHDFNNILTGIFGNLLMAKEKIEKDHPAFRLLSESGKNLDRAKSLTSQLLTFAKGGNPVMENVSIEELVKETVKFDLSGSKVKPVFKIGKDLKVAKVDYGQMQQVFSNLTINADQAMPNGGKLHVTLENIDIKKSHIAELVNGEYIKCIIRDEGTGISKKQVRQIFDPYFTTKQAGSGLGLATVYSIIKKHGGHISVDSILEKGTAFTVYLPASNAVEVAQSKQTEIEETSEVQHLSGRILVMDDEAMICELVAAILEVIGLEVETALDGEKAIDMYKKSMKEGFPFDAVIMDLTIPGGLGGKDAILNLLKIDPEVKCIVSSGYANDPIMANYSEYGFKGVVAKPYTPEKLQKALGKVLTG